MSRRSLVLCALLGAIVLLGCDAGHSSSSSSSGGDSESTDPKAMAKKSDSFALEELGKAKHPAKEWLMNTSNGTFKAKKADVVKVVDDCTAAGAIGAWVGEAEELEGKKLIDHLFIEVPTDPAKRKAIFEVYNKDIEGWVDEPQKDSGEKYLVLDWG
jgi:hypothetical protein